MTAPSSFVGTWLYDGEESPTRIVVTRCGDALDVKVFDCSDGEELRVSNLAHKRGALEFDCEVPSNGYQTHHRLVLEDDGALLHELTLFERWVKT